MNLDCIGKCEKYNNNSVKFKLNEKINNMNIYLFDFENSTKKI